MNISQRLRPTGADVERRAAAWTFTLAIVLVLFVLLSAGCCTDLQLAYVGTNEAAHAAIMADVGAGLYKPDAASTATLDAWAQSNALAREAATAE